MNEWKIVCDLLTQLLSDQVGVPTTNFGFFIQLGVLVRSKNQVVHLWLCMM
jgi:hypothetical protein